MSEPQERREEVGPLGVTDPEDFAQTQRLRQIYEARQNYQERRAEIDRIRRDNELTLYDTQEHLLAAFQSYFFEVEGLMLRHPAGDKYLEDVELGVVEHADPNSEDRVFVGLNSLTGSYRPMPTPGYSKPSYDTARPEDKVVHVSVPVAVINKGFREINKFLAEVGLDADMENETQDAEFDYSDLLEEGPPTEGDTPEINGGDS